MGLKGRKKGSRTARWSEENTQTGTVRGKCKKELNGKGGGIYRKKE